MSKREMEISKTLYFLQSGDKGVQFFLYVR